MADLAPSVMPATGWTPDSAWSGILSARSLGRAAEPGAGIQVEPIEDLGLASVIASAGQADALRQRCAAELGIEPAREPRVTHGSDLSMVWSGPGHWLALSRDAGLVSRLKAVLQGLASVSDQGASRAMLRLSGPKVREVLAKGCMVDLHPDVFRDGDVAVTVIGHVGVQLWREGDAFVVAVSRSYAASFWSWLSASMAEFSGPTGHA